MKDYQRSLLIDESPLQVIPALAVAIGLNEAIMLQQIHYWSRISEHEKAGQRWVPMSTEELAAKFPFWSESTIKRTTADLQKRKLLMITKKSDTSWERKNWYAVNYTALNHLNVRIGSERPGASGQSDLVQQLNLTQSTGSKRPDRPAQSDPVSIKGKKTAKRVAGEASPSPVSLAFRAYQAGLKKRHGAEYPPSAKANGQLAQVVARVGGANAVAVVEYYLNSKNPFYIKRRHPLDVLVKDCEQLYMDIQRSAGGAGNVVADAKPVVRLVRADEEVARDLGEFPLAAPIDVAKKVFASYRGMIQRMVNGGSKLRYLDVLIGEQRHRYSLAELEADPHPA